MEPGGEIECRINDGPYDDVKVDTAVQSFVEKSDMESFKFHESSPETERDADRKLDGYRNPICDATTVSSKKNPSASPPNQRHQTKEVVACQITSKRRTKKPSSKLNSSYVISEVRRKEKTKNCAAKRKKRNYESIAKTKATKGHYNSGRWTRMEHFKFLEALKKFGKEWQKVQQHVFTRTSTQARSHAQKFFVKLEKKQLTLEEFLSRLDIEQLKEDLRLGDAGDSTEYDEDQPLLRIANMKNKGSVMNIALPDENSKARNVQAKAARMELDRSVANEVALNNMIEKEEEGNIYSGSKRSTMQRKAKMNHTFLHKKYTETYKKENFKRRKTDVEEEAIVECEDDTKIRINQYALEEYNESLSGRSNQDITGVHDYGNALRKDSELEDILERPENVIMEEPEKEFDYSSPFAPENVQESIDGLLKEKSKENDFHIAEPDSQLEPNLNLCSQTNEWKLDSIQFTDSKQPKLEDGLRLEMNDEDSFLKDPNQGSLMDQFLPN